MLFNPQMERKMARLNRQDGVDLLLLVARLFLAFPFILFGAMKLRNSERMQAVIEAGGLPGEVIWLVIPFQILAGLAVALGWHSRVAAAMLACFCLLATSLYHNDWRDLGELAQFTKDVATAGGFIFLSAHGSGRWSVDAWTGGHGRRADNRRRRDSHAPHVPSAGRRRAGDRA
jgi:putative oxidoreductase